jgi:hypothetical protein
LPFARKKSWVQFRIAIFSGLFIFGVKGDNMKNAILIILIVACVALGALDIVQQDKLQKQSTRIAQTLQQLNEVKEELKAKSEAVDSAKLSEAKNKMLQQTLTETTSAIAEQSKKTEQLQQSLEDAKTNSPMHAMAAMFKDPKMREMIKSQQKAAMGPIISQQYGDLFKQLNLSPDQASGLKDLLQKKLLAGADAGLSLMDDSLDASQRADLAKQMKAETDDVDNEIKQFLGDDNYKALQSYEKTVPDRMTVNQFNNQFSGTDNALSPEQQQQLVQAMSEARNGFNWTSGLNQSNPGMNGDMAALLTDENLEKFDREREQFDQQFLQRAGQILTPAQLKAFEEFQINQRKMQEAGLKMAQTMFKH